MINAMLVWPWLTPEHPFTQFLSELTHDDACSPVPDIMEQATDHRLWVAFNNTDQQPNSSARLRRFEHVLKHHRRPGATVLSSTVNSKSSCCVIYTHAEMRPNESRQIFLRHKPPEESQTEMKPVVIEGCVQQPIY